MSASIEHSRVIQSVRERIVKVYVTVYEYQIRIILQYAHTKHRRAIGDMLLLNDWKKMTADINDKDLEIHRAVQTATHNSLKDGLKRINDTINKVMSMVLDSQKEISKKLDISILDRIPYVENAVFNSIAVDKQRKCLPGTQREALNTIQTWAESPDGEPIFWLAGMAGTGKSTIATTVANCLHEKKQFFSREQGLDDRTFLGATFFLSHEDPDRNTVKYVIPTIARTMAERYPDIGKYISQSIYHDTTVGTARISEQMESLLSEPLAIVSKPLLVAVRLIIIIDSIDECEKSSEAEQLLRLLPKLGVFHPLDVRLLVVSRPEKYISQIFDDPKFGVKKLTLEKTAPQVNCSDPDDITKFLKHEVASITKRRQFARDWIKSEELAQLIERADGLFIYAATTCRFLDITDDDEIQGLRLGKLIEGTAEYGTPEARLDEIYRKVLVFPTRNMSKSERDVVFKRYRSILGLIALAFEPPSVVTIERLLEREGIRKTLLDFRSILQVPMEDRSAVSFFHISFRDFLLSEEWSGIGLSINIAKVHYDMFLDCLDILDESLHQDMCSLGYPGVLASEIPKTRVHNNIPRLDKVYNNIYTLQRVL
ncbi:hypothetical protein LB507_010816 [Fusarium sp. FIESC RH6]|nr:hypothetical protein LB507_010816 [Fusarium sp. FIESC RH6]